MLMRPCGSNAVDPICIVIWMLAIGTAGNAKLSKNGRMMVRVTLYEFMTLPPLEKCTSRALVDASSIILANSLLTARGVPAAGELEIKNVQAMKILDSFGSGGSFTEYYAMDYANDVILMGHDGPGHIAIAEGKPKVRPLSVYHGKVGRGLSVEMSVKHGPVTLLSVVQTVDGRLELLVAEGESVAGPILEIGNTNSHYRFPIGARKFVEAWSSHGPAHHCAVGVGHIASKIKKLGALLGMQVVLVS
jgi:L-arabinose isomerase